MKLIIVFTKLESHSDFNGEGTIQVSNFMKEVDEDFNSIGFDEYSDHFHRFLPSTPIIGNTFNANKGNLIDIEPNRSEILLVQLTENLQNWSDGFKNDFISYAANFSQIYISYHKGPNRGDDIRNGNHRLLEELLKDKKVLTTDKYQHIDNDSQLYAVLARAIVNNQGVLNQDNYDNLVKKLISLFPNQIENEFQNLLSLKLKFLHKLLVGEVDENLKNKLSDDYDINYDPENHIETIRVIRDELLEVI